VKVHHKGGWFLFCLPHYMVLFMISSIASWLALSFQVHTSIAISLVIAVTAILVFVIICSTWEEEEAGPPIAFRSECS
jgi:hypothetical protein